MAQTEDDDQDPCRGNAGHHRAGLAGVMLSKLSPPSQKTAVPAVLTMSDATCSWRVA
jgi:hypothetical protein